MFLFRMQPTIMVLCGVMLIFIGIAFGTSVFLGNPTLFDWVFDTLGVTYVVKGLFDSWRGEKADPKKEE